MSKGWHSSIKFNTVFISNICPDFHLLVPSFIFQFAAPTATFFLASKSQAEVNHFKTELGTTLNALLEKDSKLKGDNTSLFEMCYSTNLKFIFHFNDNFAYHWIPYFDEIVPIYIYIHNSKTWVDSCWQSTFLAFGRMGCSGNGPSVFRENFSWSIWTPHFTLQYSSFFFYEQFQNLFGLISFIWLGTSTTYNRFNITSTPRILWTK